MNVLAITLSLLMRSLTGAVSVLILIVATAASAQAPAPINRATRWSFSYRGNLVHLVSRSAPLDMIAPPSDAILAATESRTGAWFEVRDQSGQPIYRRVVHELIPHSVEVPPAPGSNSPTRVSRAAAEGTFDLIVPELAGGATLSLFDSFGSLARGSPAREIARFPMVEAALALTVRCAGCTGPGDAQLFVSSRSNPVAQVDRATPGARLIVEHLALLRVGSPAAFWGWGDHAPTS